MHGTRIRKRPPPAFLLSVAALAVLIASALGYYLLAGDGPTGSTYTTASDDSSPNAILPIDYPAQDIDRWRRSGTAPRALRLSAGHRGNARLQLWSLMRPTALIRTTHWWIDDPIRARKAVRMRSYVVPAARVVVLT